MRISPLYLSRLRCSHSTVGQCAKSLRLSELVVQSALNNMVQGMYLFVTV